MERQVKKKKANPRGCDLRRREQLDSNNASNTCNITMNGHGYFQTCLSSESCDK